MSKLAVIILAGGRSRRMGRDKAELRIGHCSLIEHMCDVASGLSGVYPEVKIVVSGKADVGRQGVVCVADDPPGRGPIGGLSAAIDYLRSQAEEPEFILVIPVDMPGLTSSALSSLISMLPSSGVFAHFEGAILPLVLRTGDKFDLLLDKVARAEPKNRSVKYLLALSEKQSIGSVARIQAPSVIRPDDSQLVNINTAKEWADFLEAKGS